MRRNLTSIIMIAVACLMVSTVYAEYLLKDNSEIVGVWDVVAEAPSLDGVKRELDSIWEFKKNGALISKSKDYRAGSGTLSSKLKYRVENGKVMKEIRPGKYESCTVIEKEGTDMILKCRNLYFFLTKQQ